MTTKKKITPDVVVIEGSDDTFVSGYNKYISQGTRTPEHLRQLAKNYETAFGTTPTRDELDSAVNFAYMILAEIGECYPRTRYAAASATLSYAQRKP